MGRDLSRGIAVRIEIMDKHTKALELDKILEMVAGECSSADAAELARKLEPVHTAGAVSYTHLDVYKRQEEHHPAGLLPGEPPLFQQEGYAPGPSGVAAQKAQEQGGPGAGGQTEQMPHGRPQCPPEQHPCLRAHPIACCNHKGEQRGREGHQARCV